MFPNDIILSTFRLRNFFYVFGKFSNILGNFVSECRISRVYIVREKVGVYCIYLENSPTVPPA